METLAPQRSAGRANSRTPKPRKHSLTKSFLTAKTSSSIAPLTHGSAERGGRLLDGPDSFSKNDLELQRQLSEDLDDGDKKEKKDLPQIQVALYRKYCHKHHVTPVGVYLRDPSAPMLTLKNYSLGPAGVMALSVPLMIGTSLTHLNLEGNALGDEGIRHLRMFLEEGLSLTHLNLNNNGIGRAGAEVMSKVLLENKSLVAVSLAGNLFKDSDAVFFTQILTGTPVVKDLNLSRNQLGDGAAVLFGKALVDNTTLEVLDLSWNHIRSNGGVALLNGVKDNVCLKKLLLSYNGIGNEGCRAAGAVLTTNRTLVELDIASNRLTDTGLVSLAACVKQNDTLQVLKVGENIASGLGAQALGEAILESEECKITLLDLTNINVFDSLVRKCKERAPPRMLTLRHGPPRRYAVPREELEKRWVEEMMAVSQRAAEAAAEAAAAAERGEGSTFPADLPSVSGVPEPEAANAITVSRPYSSKSDSAVLAAKNIENTEGVVSPDRGPDPSGQQSEEEEEEEEMEEGDDELRNSPYVEDDPASEGVENTDQPSLPTPSRSGKPQLSTPKDEAQTSLADTGQRIITNGNSERTVETDKTESHTVEQSPVERPNSSGTTEHPNPDDMDDNQSQSSEQDPDRSALGDGDQPVEEPVVNERSDEEIDQAEDPSD